MKKQLKVICNKNNKNSDIQHHHSNQANDINYLISSPNKQNCLSLVNYDFHKISSPNHLSLPTHILTSFNKYLSSSNNSKLLSPINRNHLQSNNYSIQQPQQAKSTINLRSPSKKTFYETFDGFRSNKAKQFTKELFYESAQQILFSGLSKDGRYKVRSRAFKGRELAKAVQFQRKMALSYMFCRQKQKEKGDKNVFSFQCAKTSTKTSGIIKGYAVNTHNGITRDYNEDRVSITLNIKKNGLKSHFFAVYDGHGGSRCCDYLKDRLHESIINHKTFETDSKRAIRESILSCEYQFLELANKNKSANNFQKSGSCALLALIIEEYVYIANVGDSRAILSSQKGKYAFNLTRDHRPIDQKQQQRIFREGGKIYRTQMEPVVKGAKNDIIVGPLRIFPGKLSVSRTLGDIEAKYKEFGGIIGVISPQPDIRKFKISAKQDFILLCCDGILERMQSNQIVEMSWRLIREGGDIHNLGGKVVDGILRQCMRRGSSDNLTVIMIWLNEIGQSYSCH